jgi:hypothetical protein
MQYHQRRFVNQNRDHSSLRSRALDPPTGEMNAPEIAPGMRSLQPIEHRLVSSGCPTVPSVGISTGSSASQLVNRISRSAGYHLAGAALFRNIGTLRHRSRRQQKVSFAERGSPPGPELSAAIQPRLHQPSADLYPGIRASRERCGSSAFG